MSLERMISESEARMLEAERAHREAMARSMEIERRMERRSRITFWLLAVMIVVTTVAQLVIMADKLGAL